MWCGFRAMGDKRLTLNPSSQMARRDRLRQPYRSPILGAKAEPPVPEEDDSHLTQDVDETPPSETVDVVTDDPDEATDSVDVVDVTPEPDPEPLPVKFEYYAPGDL